MISVSQVVVDVVRDVPGVLPLLSARARWAYVTRTTESDGVLRTYDYYLTQLERLIKSVYDGNLGGEFIDIMANLVSGQLTQAFEQAWKDEEGEGALPDYLSSAVEEMILKEYDFIDGLYRDTVDARVDETPVEPILSRAPLWANRWNEAYETASHLIAVENGGKETWELGATEEHCWICSDLNGITLFAREWDELDVHPQGAPNPILELSNGTEKGCGGWRCDCRRVKTDKRRTPRGFETVLNIIGKA